MVAAFVVIDYSLKAFVKEAALIMFYTKGGLTKQDLESMPFNEFDEWLDEAIRIEKIMTEPEEGETDG